jgi:DNA-binding transcriptional LysR family regulator
LPGTLGNATPYVKHEFIYLTYFLDMLLAMDLKQMKYFVAVAEAGHITRAALKLGMQQPPLSQQMKALEAHVGTQLLRRHARGVSVTDAGQLLLDDARRILADVAAVEQRIARAASGLDGRLTIAFTSSAAAHRLTPDVLRGYRNAYPGVELVLDENNATGIIERIVSGKFDCGLLREPTFAPEGLVFETLLREPMLVALPAGHRLMPTAASARAPTLTLQELEEDGFILVRRPGAPGLYAKLQQLCRDSGFEARVVAEVPRMMTCLNLVAAGAGITMVPASMRGTHSHAIAYCELAGSHQFDAPLTLAYRRTELHGAVAKFAALARRAARRTGST